MKRRTILTTVLILAAALLVLAPAVQARGLSCDCGCECRSPGYWKNHPDAWPVDCITIGGAPYPKADAIAIMNMPVKGDKTYTMFKALVAAKLNLENSCDGCVWWIVNKADAWMADHNVGSGVKGSSDAWKCGEWLYKKLDWYNNNCSCYWCECCD
jgi:hypothetical protein